MRIAPLLAVLVAGAGGDPSPPPVSAPPAPAVTAQVDRVVQDPDIVESSGLALSPTHAGLLWTVNDSGNAPLVYGIDEDGVTRARVRVTDVPAVDWEALAAWRDSSGRALLAVGDIGDNGAVREEIEIDVIAEPSRLAIGGSVEPLRRIRVRYPDEPKDAESLLVDPRSGRMFVVAKGLLRARVYAVPESAWPGGSEEVATLEFIGGIGLSLATDGTVLASGHVILRSYAAVMLLAPLPDGQQPLQPLATVTVPQQRQGEGLAADADALYLSSEGANRPVLRVAMPPSFTAAMTSGPSPGPSPEGSDASASQDPAATGGSGGAAGAGDDAGPGTGDDVGRRGLLLAALAVAGLGLLVVVRRLLVRLRRR